MQFSKTADAQAAIKTFDGEQGMAVRLAASSRPAPQAGTPPALDAKNGGSDPTPRPAFAVPGPPHPHQAPFSVKSGKPFVHLSLFFFGRIKAY